MAFSDPEHVAAAILAAEKGILATDESSGTIMHAPAQAI